MHSSVRSNSYQEGTRLSVKDFKNIMEEFWLSKSAYGLWPVVGLQWLYLESKNSPPRHTLLHKTSLTCDSANGSEAMNVEALYV